MKKFIKEFIMINIGIAVLAAGIHFFLVPNQLATGGVTGIAQVVNHYVPSMSIPVLLAILNLILFIIGFIFIGPKFGTLTIYASFALSGIIAVFEKVYPMTSTITNDLFIELLFGAGLTAAGLGIVFNQNSSTGGTDILAKIVNKYFHLDLGKAMLCVDFLVTIAATIAFGAKKGMYSILGVFIIGILVDVVIEGMNICKKVEIVSSKGEEIKDFIINELERGATIYTAKGAYTNETREVITAVMGKKEFIKLRNYIKELDKKAFIMTYNIHETLGEGFKDIME